MDAPHEYGPSRIGHGEAQCKWCHGTNRENAIISPNHCEARAAAQPAAPSSNEQVDNLAAVIDKQDAEIKRLRGELEAAEQHVKILQEQVASFAPAHETKAPRSVEGLQTYPYREGELQPVKPVLGTPNEVSDATLANLIKYENHHSNFCAFVELWERRGAVKSTAALDEMARINQLTGQYDSASPDALSRTPEPPSSSGSSGDADPFGDLPREDA